LDDYVAENEKSNKKYYDTMNINGRHDWGYGYSYYNEYNY